MKTLAFDTSTKYLTVALLDGEEVVKSHHEDAGVRHSELLAPTIDEMLKSARWGISDIGLVAVGIGPGSFTGLRIAVATVKGLACAAHVKVKGVPTFDAIAVNALSSGKRLIAPLLDAKKGKVYSCIYEIADGVPVRKTEHLLVDIRDLLKTLECETFFLGDGIITYRQELERCPLAFYDEKTDWYPRASEIGKIALKLSSSGTDDPDTLEPLYLHAKECNITRKNA